MDISKKVKDTATSISKLESDLERNVTESLREQTDLAIANATATEIASSAVKFGYKTENFKIAINELKAQKESLENQQTALQKAETEINKKLEASKARTADLYAVSRALALGAIGALASIFFAQFRSAAPSPINFDDRKAMAWTAGSMAMGAMAAVAVASLFFTGYISFFSSSEPTSQNTDYWKVTILCLLAGAFFDRLYQEAGRRIDRYFGSATQE